MDIKKLLEYRIILASKSPRRYQLIKEMGFDVEVLELETDETLSRDINLYLAPENLALRKSEAAKNVILTDKEILITSDTMVFLEDKSICKPKNKQEAISFLSSLSNKKHSVITGCCIKTSKRTMSFSERTNVYFAKLSQEEIRYYVENYKPYDKAGAYGIQEWIGLIGVEKIEGCYYNVMGLPTRALFAHLKEIIKR